MARNRSLFFAASAAVSWFIKGWLSKVAVILFAGAGRRWAPAALHPATARQTASMASIATLALAGSRARRGRAPSIDRNLTVSSSAERSPGVVSTCVVGAIRASWYAWMPVARTSSRYRCHRTSREFGGPCTASHNMVPTVLMARGCHAHRSASPYVVAIALSAAVAIVSKGVGGSRDGVVALITTRSSVERTRRVWRVSVAESALAGLRVTVNVTQSSRNCGPVLVAKL